MASYHCSMKNGLKGKATPHASYICREGKYKDGTNEELKFVEHGNMPEWAEMKPKEFWKAADQFERANGRTYSEVELALPNELTKDQQIELTKAFIKENIGSDHTYTVAIHSKSATLDGKKKNPHAHIMFSERKLDGIKRDKELFFKRANSKNPELGGTKKDRDKWHGQDTPVRLRSSWEKIQNTILEKYNHEVRVDRKSIPDQRKEALEKGDFKKAELLDRIPERHLGPKLIQKTLRELERHMSDGKTTKEKLKLREEYLSTIKNDKIRQTYIARQFKTINERIDNYYIKKEQQKEKVSILQISKEANDKSINIIRVRELAEILKQHITETDKQVRELSNIQKEVSHKIISPERAMLIAISVFTKKENKLLDKETELIKLEREKIKEDVKKFRLEPKPAFFDISGKKKYNTEADRLRKWNGELSLREEENTLKNDQMRKRLSVPSAVIKLESIRDGVLKRNEPEVTNFKKVTDEIGLLRTERGEAIKIRTNLTMKIRLLDKGISINGELSGSNITKQSGNIQYQLEKAVRELSKEPNQRGGIKVNLHMDEERGRNGQDFER